MVSGKGVRVMNNLQTLKNVNKAINKQNESGHYIKELQYEWHDNTQILLSGTIISPNEKGFYKLHCRKCNAVCVAFNEIGFLQTADTLCSANIINLSLDDFPYSYFSKNGIQFKLTLERSELDLTHENYGYWSNQYEDGAIAHNHWDTSTFNWFVSICGSEYAEENYKRVCSFNGGDWQYLDCHIEAIVDGTVIAYSDVFGIESDCVESWNEELQRVIDGMVNFLEGDS